MKIVFLGTPEFAVPSLDILVQNGYEIAAVVTAPGKKAGRGLQVKEPAVKIYAVNAGLRILQPDKLNDPLFIAELKALSADVFVVVAFRMLPEKVWGLPPGGTFNLHASLLPQYRGAAPINRAIMNGETQTGVTTFFLTHEIDTGNIIYREKVDIHPGETAGELHDRLKIAGAHLVLKTIRAIEQQQVHEVSQESLLEKGEELKTAPKIFTGDCRIQWNRPAREVHNQVRGLSPFPGAYTRFENEKGESIIFKIFRSELNEIPAVSAGTIQVSGDRFFISCNDFMLEILELQQEGKKRTKASEFVKGFRQEKGWRAV